MFGWETAWQYQVLQALAARWINNDSTLVDSFYSTAWSYKWYPFHMWIFSKHSGCFPNEDKHPFMEFVKCPNTGPLLKASLETHDTFLGKWDCCHYY